MGADIHVQIERHENGAWHRVPHPDRECMSSYCEGGTTNDKVPNEKMRGKPCWHCQGTGRTVEPFYSDRNYNVFGILANVRNGTGFAGVDTGDGFVPISDPRGLPDDLSEEIREALRLDGYVIRDGEPHYEPNGVVGEAEREDSADYRAATAALLGAQWEATPSDSGEYTWWSNPQHFYLGDHSFSHLTVAELLGYDWDRTTKLRGWVDPWQFEVWRTKGRPTNWSGGISGNGIEHISNAHMARMIDDGEIEWAGDEPDEADWLSSRPYTTSLQRSMKEWDLPEGSVGAAIRDRAAHFTQVEWEISYRECAAGFLTILERDIVPLGPPEDVRLVFGFDS